MDDNLDLIFSLSLVQSNEATSLATMRIIEMANDPQSIFPLLQHLKANKDKTIRQAMAITITKMAKMHAKYYIQSDYFVKLKENLLNSILFEKDQIVKDKLLTSVVSLFKETQANWDELLDFIQKLLQNNTDSDLLLFFDIFRNLLPFISYEFISQLFQVFISNNLENPKTIAVNTLIEMMNLVIELEKYIEMSSEVFNKIYIMSKDEILKISQQKYNDKLGALSDVFLKFISVYIDFIDFDDVLNLINSILENENISVDNKILVLPILEPIVKYSDINGKISFQQLILIVLEFITVISSEYDLNDTNDFFPAELIAAITKKCPQLEFFQFISEALEKYNVSDTSALILLLYALDDIKPAIQLHILEIFQFIRGNIDNENFDNIKLSLMLLNEIFQCRFQELKEISEDCNQMFLGLLNTSDNDTLVLVLKALASYFSAVPISPEYFPEFCSRIVKLLQNSEHQSAYLGFECINELINSAQDCVTPYLSEIYNKLKEFAYNDKIYDLIRSSSIESLGLLLEAGNSVDEPILDDYFALIFGILDSYPDEISPFFAACLNSLAKTCKIKLLEVGGMIQRITSAMQQNDNDSIAASLEFLKSYFKYCTIEDVSDHYDVLKNILLQYFRNDLENDLLTLNVKAIFRFSVLFGKVDDEFLTVIKTFADDLGLLSLFLYFFRKIFNSEIEVNDEVIDLYIRSVLHVISPSFEEEEIKDDGFNSFSLFAKKYPNKFPYDEFFNITTEYAQENHKLVLECTGIYTILFQPNSDKIFVESVADLFFSTLIYCDFNNIPHNLVGIEKYIEAGFPLDQKMITQLIDSAQIIYSSDFSGESQYYLTIYGFNLVMFSAFSHITFDDSIVSKFLPVMFEQAKNLNFQTESDKLFQNAVKVCYKYSYIVKDFGQKVIDFFLKPLICSIQIFKKLKLDTETLQNISSYLSDCINSDPKCSEYILSLLNDPIIRQRFVERSNILLI